MPPIRKGRTPTAKKDIQTISGKDPQESVSSIFVRKSQTENFEAHALEVFRLKNDGIKYLETYFDYKFPFPKLDLVLIPEFPFGGMEHAGAIFLREDRVIFPAEPTKGDYLTRANLIFHETAHQWFGDTVTMKWFDDLWLKEGFAEFMAYKTLEKVMPDANAWKVFYERNKQAAYLTDSTRGTTPIYQPIANLSAAKSAYGNIVYRKAPSFLRQAEFYLGEDKFQTAVRAFFKKHEFGNAGWEDLVGEFETASEKGLKDWANSWVLRRGMPLIAKQSVRGWKDPAFYSFFQRSALGDDTNWREKWQFLQIVVNSTTDHEEKRTKFDLESIGPLETIITPAGESFSAPSFQGMFQGHDSGKSAFFGFPSQGTYFVYLLNYSDYGYGIFLLDDKSRDYVLKNVQNEKDPFLRSMMWGSLWDSVREAELDPRVYVELAIKNLGGAPDAQARTSVRAVREHSPPETDETIVASVLGRVSIALNYYMPAPATALTHVRAYATDDLRSRFEAVLLDRLQHAPTAGERITFYRAFVANATTDKARVVLKQMLAAASITPAAKPATPPNQGGESQKLRTKDKFDIVTRLAILGDPDAPRLLAELEKTETSDEAKRYAYAAHAAFGTAANKAKFFNDFLTNKDISESWIESAIVPFNSIDHADLTQQYLERSLKELPNLKRTRKIFFINNWLAAFIGGQRDEKALAIVNKFLADNSNLDNDLRLKVLENVDLIERAVKIRNKYP